MNEEQILSEYMDGELPPDLHSRVEQRLASDPAFKARLSAMQAIRDSLRAGHLDSVQLSDMQAHVWQKMQRHLGGRAKGWVAFWDGLSDALHRRIALPLPAMAAMVVVFLTISVIAISRGNGGEGSVGAVASNQSNASVSAPVEFNPGASGMPSGIGVMPVASQNVTVAGFRGDINAGEIPADQRMQITIQVQSLRQLAKILRQNQEIDRVTIQIPQYRNLRSLGNMDNLSQELGVNQAIPYEIKVGSQY